MHDGMPYDPIQGQGQGHEFLKATRGVDHQSHTGLILLHNNEQDSCKGKNTSKKFFNLSACAPVGRPTLSTVPPEHCRAVPGVN